MVNDATAAARRSLNTILVSASDGERRGIAGTIVRQLQGNAGLARESIPRRNTAAKMKRRASYLVSYHRAEHHRQRNHQRISTHAINSVKKIAIQL